ncbi:MAG: aldose 1-epimerase [Candidatus Poribacteria bacterium]|jgi:aldose 1-epimerase|nr:aldose 1-epimerase [Candidatus Poribacteria bacterium]MDP6749139.1 aldose 1-epimerase [Candidatus Poribacteria bacterium]MDP6998885.1 aldose 1-epimerase [Candidatus Poribacteria bacterium]
MSSSSIGHRAEDGIEVYTLQTGSTKAEIVPAIGANCTRFAIQTEHVQSSVGEWIDLIAPPPSLAVLKQRPSGFGNPILFPFPNRIRNGSFSFEGQDYAFDKPDNSPNSIHGLLLDYPFSIQSIDMVNGEKPGVEIICSVDSEQSVWISRQYPFPFLFQVTYTLTEECLEMSVQIENRGKKRMPMGFGIHPYFQVLFSPDSTIQTSWITIPAAQYWELDAFLPTGRLLDADPEFLTGKCFKGLQLDDVFTQVIASGAGASSCRIDDRQAGVGLLVEADANFREWVVYTPPDRPEICFEPYTCPTDAINLEARGIPAGLVVLEPVSRQGSSFSASVQFRVELNG